MREYKFRGKRLDNDEWVEGYYGKKTHPRTGEDQHYILVNVSLMASASSYFVNYEVDPATVGQFTGLCDMKAQEIYEGDILYHTYEDCLGKAVWDNEAACWDLMFPTEDGGFVLERLCDHADISIIVGNTYDDPQLTEGSIK